MKKFYLCMMVVVAMLCVSFGAKATGWPANYQGVMLQGFYWDSYSDTKWTTLESKADEYSKYFTLIWVPNSAKPASNPGMGYDPVYWFTNHTSSFGNEAQLRSMIKTYKEKGVGIIEDVVVNHRSGASNWYNFPSETWNGKTWQLTTGSICSTDEVWRDGGHGCPASYKGAPDTGEDFGSSRDLDHTNPTVQDHVKNYCKFLIDDLGYVGFRLDMVKGYGGQYTKIYNQYSKPQFCVGECFDGSYDVCAAWIEATGKESASFDFPLKFQLNKAFPSANSYNLTELCWTNPSGAKQPAGLIHYGYPQYSVTFVDNHDTYRDHNKFNGNVLAANAFILCSPGTPCVFLRHYLDNKTAIQQMIDVRNAVGVHNLSQVNVLKCESNCYMAEVTGTKGKLVVRIGTTNDQPSGSGYTLKCSGNGYAIWSTTSGGVVVPDPDLNTSYNVYFKNTRNWTTPYIHYWGNTESTWPGVAMSKVSGTTDIWSYTVPAGTTGILFNAGDGDPTKTADFVAIPNHLYTVDGDQGVYDGSEVPTPKPGNYPASLYLMGHTNGYAWATDKGIEAKGTNGVYNWSNVTFDDSGDGTGYFAFSTLLGESWDVVNSSDRYGASTSDKPIALGDTDDITLYAANVSASGSQSWKINAGSYSVTADLSKMKITIAAAGTKPDPTPDPDPDPDPIPGTYPATVYVMGNVNGAGWATDKGVEAKGDNGVYNWGCLTVDDAGAGYGYFAFVTVLGTTGTSADWDDVINTSDRYGAPASDTPIEVGQSLPVTLYAAGINASASESWMLKAGTYALKLDLSKMLVSVNNVDSGVEDVEFDVDAPVQYFNLQGVRVENPAQGIYIRVQGNKVSKVIVR